MKLLSAGIHCKGRISGAKTHMVFRFLEDNGEGHRSFSYAKPEVLSSLRAP